MKEAAEEDVIDVVVVGAGISGLAAARLLTGEGLNVVMLEARDRLGGRTLSVEKPAKAGCDETGSDKKQFETSLSNISSQGTGLQKGDEGNFNSPASSQTDQISSSGRTTKPPSLSDLGAGYVGPTQRRVARLARDLGLDLYKVSVLEGKTVLRYNERWLDYWGTVPPLKNPIELLDVNNILRTTDNMAKTVPVDCPWEAEKAELWDSMTLEQFLRSKCWTEAAYQLSRLMCLSIICAEPKEVSLLSFLHYIHSGQGVYRLTNVTGGAQERKIAGGAMMLCVRMAQQLKNPVRLNSAVTHIDQSSCLDDSDKSKESLIEIKTLNGDVIKARYVILALPPMLLRGITFTPPLSHDKLSIIQRAPMGSLIKTMTFYKQCYWKENGFSGQAVSNIGPISYCLDDSGPSGDVPCLMGFVSREETPRLTRLSREERSREIAAFYAETFRCQALLEPTGYLEKNWAEEPYSSGCVMFYPPGVLTGFCDSGCSEGSVLRQPHHRVHFAGTELARDAWVGYMDGAIESGERAAREVLKGLGRLGPGEPTTLAEPMKEGYPDSDVERMWVEDWLPSVGVVMSLIGFIGSCLVAYILYKIS